MRWLPLVVLAVMALTRPARADDVLFYWVDKAGTVHATQNIDEVPEPYGAMYRARLKELEEEKKKKAAASAAPSQPAPTPPTPAPAPPAPVKPSLADAELARQKAWRAEIAKWRNELRLATEDLQRVQTRLGEVQSYPYWQAMPQMRAQVEPLEEERQQALARVEVARGKLTIELPERAKRERVPPYWWD